ncbi:MAG TPA: hypothetical protein EYO16_07445 [Candidatus Marinimicrobia bacterium]|jgi:hypothetical protein|nr:hypothetical protein [Candidatus Neomarinimicrobiota bacterium]
MIAYLSGGMENAQNEGADWRTEITVWLKNNLDHEVIDPVLESEKLVIQNDAKDYRDWKTTNPGKFKEFIRLLINQDLRAVIGKADYLIVLWDESILYGGGTHGEVTMAYWVDRPVFLINKLPEEKLSAWISSCATETFGSIDGLKEALLKEFSS